jgi:hypothetical protein
LLNLTDLSRCIFLIIQQKLDVGSVGGVDWGWRSG